MKNWKMIVMTLIIAALVVALVLIVIETQTKKPIRLAEKRVAELRVIEEEARLTYSILEHRRKTAGLQKALPVPKTD